MLWYGFGINAIYIYLNTMKINPVTFLFIIFSTLLIANPSVGQVGDIKKEFKTPKGNSSSGGGSNNYSSGGGDQLAANIFINMFGFVFSAIGHGIAKAQENTLEKKPEFPEIISLEGSLNTGLYLEENGTNYNPRIQGNWGIFSSELRYTHISDLSGKLGTIDWQIVKINIPINPVKISGGLGFCDLPELRTTFFESSVKADVWVWKRKINTSLEFRSTEKIGTTRFRQEFNFQVDYKVKSFGRFHISPMVGIKHQSYFEKYEQTYFMVGCNFRLQ